MADAAGITIFLSQCGAEQLAVRTELAQVLKSAGMKVIPDLAQFDDKKISNHYTDDNAQVPELYTNIKGQERKDDIGFLPEQ